MGVSVSQAMVLLFFVSSFLLFLSCFNCCTCMRVRGKWSTSSFGETVARFGFDEGGNGFFYGNITTPSKIIYNSATLVFVNADYYNKKTALYRGLHGHTNNCTAMMEPLVQVALMPRDTCTKTDIQGDPKDYLRSVPCAEDGTCLSQPGSNVPGRKWPYAVPLAPGSQFTFRVTINKPEDWYVLLIACSISPLNITANETWKDCDWKITPNEIFVDYDLWLVNGNPNSTVNLFTFQFSFELQGVLAMCLAFLVLYVGLVFVHFCGVLSKNAPGHTLPRLFTAALISELLGIVFQFIHYLVYAKNGVGVESLRDIGDFCVVVTQCLFMLLLLLIAKGWTITTIFLINRKYLAGLWIFYVILYIILFVVNTVVSNSSHNFIDVNALFVTFFPQTSLNEFSGRSAYQSIPGGFILALRCLILIWFLYELRNSYLQENVPEKLNLYRFLGVFYTFWFIYLPVAVGALSDIDVLYQFKVIFGTLHSADFVSLAAMAWLLWPSRSKAYFKLVAPDNRRLLESLTYDKI